jgi:hypothetical protein
MGGMKQNCWEYFKCGREPGGERADKLGVCPASQERKLNGIHGGKNGGRACWVVAGTNCERENKGNSAKKEATCTACEFYQLVKDEEHSLFIFSGTLLTNVLHGKRKARSSEHTSGTGG